ncbi:thrombospondin type 3 repeat-containing protein [Candidatus Pacebacteria bacterium]|nr:thrombospondin type 3 repeat-containing protein [Candidatus Paceibacterota bacterium]
MLSQKVISVIAISVLLVGGIIGFDLIKDSSNSKEDHNQQQEKDEENVSQTPNIKIGLDIKSESNSDTDGDGLFDWEEELRGSDKTKVDTDGDGTNDKEEVQEGRDPSVAGPNDKLVDVGKIDLSVFDDPNSNVRYTEGTLSESVATNFISNYLTSGTGNPSAANQISQNIAQDVAEIANISNKYNILNIKTFPDYEKDKIRKYGNDFSSIVVDYYATFSIAENPDEEVYINIISLIFENFAKDLSQLSVPRGIADEHLDFINNTYKVSVALKKIIASKEDPVSALFALGQYEEIGTEQPLLFAKIADYFEANDIIFSEEETGIMWHNF